MKRFFLHVCLLLGVGSLAGRAAADSTTLASTWSSSPPELPERRAPRWPWIGPSVQVATIAGASAIAYANGLEPGRIALDTLGASLGAGIGVLGMALLVKNTGLGNDPIKAIFYSIPVLIGACAMGGLALGEMMWSDESPLPARTVWPTFGGFAIGAVIDIGALVTSSGSSPPNNGATVVSAILAPLTIGTTTVAGYSIRR
jgi:hypothetical protein